MNVIRTAWAESSDFVRREWGLLFTVSMATCGLAKMCQVIIRQGGLGSGEGGLLQIIGLLVTLFLTVLGNLTLIALALCEGRSVHEALQLAVSRFPKFLLMTLLMGMVILPLFYVVLILVQLTGSDLAVVPPRLNSLSVLILLSACVAAFWFSVRISTFMPLIVMKEIDAITALLQSFRATRPVTAKLFAVLGLAGMGYLMLSQLLNLLAASLLLPLAKSLGTIGLGVVVVAVLAGILGATISVYLMTFQARLAVQLHQGDTAKPT